MYNILNDNFFLFADDTNAPYAHKHLKTLELTVNAELHNLFNWLTSSKLSLNVIKSQTMLFFVHTKKNSTVIPN